MTLVYKNIAFDLDGTLVDSSRDLQSALNEARLLFDINKSFTHDEVVSFIGEGARVLCEKALDARGLSRDKSSALLEAFRNAYQEHHLKHSKPYAGVLELLTRLQKAGAKMAVCTNKPRAFANPIVEHFFGGLFEFVLGPEDVALRKPDPAMLKKAQTNLGTLDLFVGDSMTDLRCAEAAQVPFIAVAWGFQERQILSQACGQQSALVETIDALTSALFV